jgi:hypothetical protein
VAVAREHWMKWAWRPFLAFTFGFLVFAIYVGLPLSKVPVPVVPTEVWLAFGGVLGPASWFRGKMQADRMSGSAGNATVKE